MKENLISVIVPVYKVEPYLKRCVDSIINQTYKNLEIILIDDGSPDNCPKICDDYAKKDNRIKVFHIKNAGVSNARNLGIIKSQGQFVAFVDADDYVEPNMYELLLKKQQENNYDIVFSRYNTIQEETISHVVEVELENLCKNNDLSGMLNIMGKKEFKEGKEFIHNAILCAVWRDLFKKSVVQNFKFNENVKMMEDVLFMCELITKNPSLKLGYVDEFLYNYVIREDSSSRACKNFLVEDSIFFIQDLINILKGTKYESYIGFFKFRCYSDCLLQKIKYKIDMNLESINDWNSRENYKKIKKQDIKFKTKILFFLVRHKLNKLIKLAYKITK